MNEDWGRGHDLPDVDNVQTVFYLLRQVLDIFAVLGRQDDGLNTGSKCPDQLLLDAPNCCDAATKRYFSLSRMSC